MPTDATEGFRGIALEKLTPQDTLDLAVLVEEEARERYQVLARQVGGRYAGDASDMFRFMAENEGRHGAQLADRREELFGDAPRRVTREMLYEIEAPDLGSPRVFMSARQALEVALSSEQKARAFFAAAARVVQDAHVRGILLELEREEVEHEGLVRVRLEALPPGPDLEDDEADEPGTDPGN